MLSYKIKFSNTKIYFLIKHFNYFIHTYPLPYSKSVDENIAV